MPIVAYSLLVSTGVKQGEWTYHVLNIEGVLGEAQNQARFSDGRVAQEYDLKLHLACQTIPV